MGRERPGGRASQLGEVVGGLRASRSSPSEAARSAIRLARAAFSCAKATASRTWSSRSVPTDRSAAATPSAAPILAIPSTPNRRMPASFSPIAVRRPARSTMRDARQRVERGASVRRRPEVGVAVGESLQRPFVPQGADRAGRRELHFRTRIVQRAHQRVADLVGAGRAARGAAVRVDSRQSGRWRSAGSPPGSRACPRGRR